MRIVQTGNFRKITRLCMLGLLLLPAGLRLKDNAGRQFPLFGNLPELITVEDKLYSREGCSVPANVENCDITPYCYTLTYLTSAPDQPFRRLGASSAPGFPASLPVYSGPRPVSYRPNVYVPYGDYCFIRYQSVGMG